MKITYRNNLAFIKQQITHEQAAAIEKNLVSRVNRNPDTGIMGADMVATYHTADGRTLIEEYGNGYAQWFELKEQQ